jgi:hypothetical protein
MLIQYRRFHNSFKTYPSSQRCQETVFVVDSLRLAFHSFCNKRDVHVQTRIPTLRAAKWVPIQYKSTRLLYTRLVRLAVADLNETRFLDHVNRL